MVGSVHTYALIKALYDEGEDYVDSFWPIVVKTTTSNQSITSKEIQAQLRRSSDLEVPLHVLQVILTRAEQRGYVHHWTESSTGSTKYRLTSDGIKYSAKLETDKEVERRINALMESVRQFFEAKNVSLSFEKVRELLTYFVHKNIDFLAECMTPSAPQTEIKPPKIAGSNKYLLEYIQSAEHEKPDHYKTLENLVLGSIISVLLHVDQPAEMTKIRTEAFNHCKLFLDTNFVFSILGLHTDEFNAPAIELFNLVRKHNFDLKVFSFTVDELCKVVNSYPEQSHRYPTNIRVNSLYSSLKTKGWGKTDAREFITNVEQILQEKGITVQLIRDINLSKYTSDEKLKEAIKIYKPEQNDFHRNHDLAAIAEIKELRKKAIHRIENCRALFLTSDYRLSRFNLIEEGHKQTATICETILDRLMTSILWLKNPSTKLSLKTIIAAHSRGLFVNRRVWDHFYDVLQKLKREGKIGDDDIGTLFWHSYLEDTLRSIEENEVYKVTPDFVLENIEEAERLRDQAIKNQMKTIEKTKDKEMEMKLRMKEKAFSETLKQSLSDTESRKDKEWLDKIQSIREGIREDSDGKARFRSIVLTLVVELVVIGAIVIGYLLLPNDVLDLILTGVGFGGMVGIWQLRHGIRERLFRRIHMRKLKEANLDKIV